jgi:translocation and assembly module TamB
VQGWRSPRASLARLEARWRSGDDAQAPLALDLDARQLVVDQQRIDLAEAKLAGSLARHSVQLNLSSPLKPPAWTENLLGPAGSGSRLALTLQGQWQRSPDGGSRWQLQNLALRGGPRDAAADARPWLLLQDLAGELQLDAEHQPRAASLSPGNLQLLSASVRWTSARWQRGARPQDSELDLNAELDTIHVASWLQRLQPGMGWSGNLDIGGRLQLRAGARMEAEVVLERQRGDLAITDELGQRQALGLSELRLALTVRDGVWQFAQGLAGQQIGEIVGAQVVRSTPERRWPEAGAPMQGVLQARVANLGVWGTWVPPGWRLAGTLQTTATLGGRFGAPELSGELRGSGLGVRNLLEGVNLSDGELAIQLQGGTARIERFSLRGGDGRASLTGGATLGAEPSLTLQLTAEQFRVLGRIDRRISTSGRAALRVTRGKVQLDGDFNVDEGLIDVSRADAPRLDGDVQVRRAPAAASAPAARAVPGPVAVSGPPGAASAPPAEIGRASGRERVS